MKPTNSVLLLVLILVPTLAIADLHFDISYHETLKKDQSQIIKITLYNEVNHDLEAEPVIEIYGPDGDRETISTKVTVPAKKTTEIVLSHDTAGKIGKFQFNTKIDYGQHELDCSTSIIKRYFNVIPIYQDTVALSFMTIPIIIGSVLAQFYMLLKKGSKKREVIIGTLILLLLVPGISQDLKIESPSQAIIGDKVLIFLKTQDLTSSSSLIATVTIESSGQPIAKYQNELISPELEFVWDTSGTWPGDFEILAQVWDRSKLIQQETSTIELEPAPPLPNTPTTVALSFSPILVLGLLGVYLALTHFKPKNKMLEVDNTYNRRI